VERIVILASGNGSNALKILEHFKQSKSIEIVGVFSNKKSARVIEEFKKKEALAIDFDSNEELLELLLNHRVTFIALAGYLKLIPAELIHRFENRIINLHPSLLPKHSGKGMYGLRVHESVKKSSDTETGITIHYVNEIYDEGEIIFQAACRIDKLDTPERIAEKVLALEHHHLPRVIEQIVESR